VRSYLISLHPIPGTEYIDTVTIAPGAVISQQSIGVASNATATGFFTLDGIMGCVEPPDICLCIRVNFVSHSLGPRDLTLNSTFPDNSTIIPTVTDNLVKQGTIKRNIVAFYLVPSNSTSDVNVNSELTFGGTNRTNYIGDITYQSVCAAI
jgi:hypothetical protein